MGKRLKYKKLLVTGYAEHKQPFDEIKHLHTLKEVGDVAEGAYDWKIEKGQRSLISM